ncbi:MAG: DUF2520 domain-containing protein [Nannocystis sp.]|nr:DUF2520 domain-containing protein [Nannocystis sp.]
MTRPVLAVLGGSFNPPHLGHVLIPPYLLARGLADRVLVAPCWSHPFAKEIAPFADRLLWTRLAMAAHGPKVSVTDLEAELAARRGAGPSYTIDLLDALQAAHPGLTVRLVVGSDITARGELDRWREADRLRREYAPIVIPRAGYAQASALPELSSTDIRRWLAAADPDARARLTELLPAALLPLLLDPPKGTIWLIGQGHVASHVDPWLRGRGWRVSRLGARDLVAGTALPDPIIAPQAPPPAGIWALCRDHALPEIAAALTARLPTSWRQVPVLHAAGAIPAASERGLGALRAAGWPVGTLHPIASLRREQSAHSPLADAAFGVEGDPPAIELAHRLIGDQPALDLSSLDARLRTAYHAACAFAANHLAVLFGESRAILRAQGHPAAAVDAALAVLLRSALDNLVALGLPAGLTGPAVRGEWGAVAAHAAALEPAQGALYSALAARLALLVAPSSA